MGDVNNDIERYRRGEMSPAEMHALERRALSDPFLADALEGAESVSSEDFSEDVEALNKAIRRPARTLFTPLRIAAAVVLLVGAGLFLTWPADDAPMVAQQAPQESMPDSIKQDDVTKPLASTTEQQLASAEKPKVDASNLRKEQLSSKDVKPSETDKVSRQPEAEQYTAIDTNRMAASPTVADISEAGQKIRNTTKISGNVTVAEDGLPLPGVNVTVKGTTVGTTTDIYGNYTLDAPPNSQLVFSFVGMQTSERAVTGNGPLDVKLSEDATQLSEVVITRSALPRPDSEEPIVKMAEPVGGIKAYDKYMEDNLRYPQQALDNNVKGRVVVEFSVGVDGRVGDFVVMRSLGYGCDDEVIRLVKEGPQWLPTTEDNKPVMSNVRVRMKFDAAKQKKK